MTGQLAGLVDARAGESGTQFAELDLSRSIRNLDIEGASTRYIATNGAVVAVASRRDVHGSGPIQKGSLLVAADCHLTNRRNLAHELQLQQSVNGAIPADAEIVLAAWRRWGTTCFARFEGTFAIAIWDTEQRQLTLGRDRLGVKPLFFGRCARGWAFSSQIGGVLGHIDNPRLDLLSAALHALVLDDQVHSNTLIAGVARVLPAQWVTIGANGVVRSDRYWRPSDLDLSFHSPGEWATMLGAEIRDATNRACRDASNVVAHLSGGLDSSAISCLAANAVASPSTLKLVSFSAPSTASGVAGEPVDAPFIRAVSDHVKRDVIYASDPNRSFSDQLAAAAPGVMPPPYGTTSLHRSLASDDTDVALSGWGGDEFSSFNARGHLADLVGRGALKEALSLARSVTKSRTGVARLLVKRGLYPLRPDWMFWAVESKLKRNGWVDRLPRSVLDRQVARELGIPGVLTHQLRERRGTRRNQLALLESDHLLRRMERWAADAGRFGIDYRYPLLDPAVIELSLAIPGDVHMRGGFARWPFRQGMEGIVPADILWRPDKKDSYGAASSTAVASSAAVIKSCRDLVSTGNDLGGLLDLCLLRERVDELERGEAGPGQRVLLHQVMRLAAFADHNSLR